MPLQLTLPHHCNTSGGAASSSLSLGLGLFQNLQQQEDHDDDDADADADARSDTSSIGACSSSASHSLQEDQHDAEDDNDEVQSKPNQPHPINKTSLGSLHSLDDSLPYKRGLSNFYSGKSKSFTALSAAAAAKDIVKPENPINKRRRLFIARSRNRRASCSSLVSIAEAADPPFLPLLPPVLSDEDDQDDEAEESLEQASPPPSDHQQPRQFMMRRSRTEKRRPSLFTVSVTPFEARHDHDSFLTPKLVRSGSGSSGGNLSLKSAARSLSLSDLSRHAHLAHH